MIAVGHINSGEWRMESGKWRVESGEWRVENGKRTAQLEMRTIPSPPRRSVPEAIRERGGCL
jgi:hypothetical protein